MPSPMIMEVKIGGQPGLSMADARDNGGAHELSEWHGKGNQQLPIFKVTLIVILRQKF